MADNERILEGKEPVEESVNSVNDVPKKFKEWLEDNKERAKRSFSVPYFITDNKKYLPAGYLNLYALKTPYATYAEYEAAMKYNKAHSGFTPEQLANNRKLSQALPVIQGKIMNFTEADQGKSNPNYALPDANERGFHHNCQTCTVSYELRRRGFDVEATASPLVEGYKKYRDFERFCTSNRLDWRERFLTQEGKRAGYVWSRAITKDTIAEKLSFIEAQTAQQGRYEIYCEWKDKDAGAHVFIVERQKNGELLWFDPQSSRRGGSFNDYLSRMRKNLIGVLRIDDKIINPKFSSRFTKRQG